MDIIEAMKARHSVRSYKGTPIEASSVKTLQTEIDACNQESDLHIQLVINDKQAFDSFMAHYGKFSGVQNYIALIGRKSPSLEEQVGYYGQRIVLLAQTLELNTCWVAMTFRKKAVKSICEIAKGEKLVCILALGYGETQGISHKSKPLEQLYRAIQPIPTWFQAGIEAAALAPTAMNQQKFYFTLSGGMVRAESTGGFYSKVDLGIVKYHFEIGAGRENFKWENVKNDSTSRISS